MSKKFLTPLALLVATLGTSQADASVNPAIPSNQTTKIEKSVDEQALKPIDLKFVLKRSEDQEVQMAYHRSHRSHSSHRSHYSSRY